MAAGVYPEPGRSRPPLDFRGPRLLPSRAATHTRRTFLGGVASLAASSIAIRSAQAQTPTAAAPVKPGAAAQTASGAAARRGIKLGLDHFAIRGFNWKAPQLIDYAASQKLDGIFLSELNVLESRDEAYLKGLRAQAE